MPATITYNTASTTSVVLSSIASIKAQNPAIGLADSAIVRETSTELIYKITQGTGTYADTYLRLHTTSSVNLFLTLGTGFDSGTNVITGAGTSRRIFYQSGTASYYVRTIVTSDNTVGLAQFVNTSTGLPVCAWGYVKPTNTSITAASNPLTNGLGTYYGASQTYYYRNAYITGDGGAFTNTGGDNFSPWYKISTGYEGLNQSGNLCYTEPSKRLGSLNAFMLGAGGIPFGYASSTGSITSDTVLVVPLYSATFALQYTEGGNSAVIPNVPIFSGGRPLGYNSNLAFCSPRLVSGDRIIVTSGTEEYVALDATGVAVRQV
jgi:hypothetical protein